MKKNAYYSHPSREIGSAQVRLVSLKVSYKCLYKRTNVPLVSKSLCLCAFASLFLYFFSVFRVCVFWEEEEKKENSPPKKKHFQIIFVSSRRLSTTSTVFSGRSHASDPASTISVIIHSSSFSQRARHSHTAALLLHGAWTRPSHHRRRLPAAASRIHITRRRGRKGRHRIGSLVKITKNN